MAVTPQPSPAKPTIPQNAIALDLDPQSCVCHLGQVDVALLSLPNVWRLDWNTEIFRVWMLFRDADTPRPTDAQISEAIAATDVELKAIHRP